MNDINKYRKENFNLISLIKERDIKEYEKINKVKISLLNELDYNSFIKSMCDKKKNLFKINLGDE